MRQLSKALLLSSGLLLASCGNAIEPVSVNSSNEPLPSSSETSPSSEEISNKEESYSEESSTSESLVAPGGTLTIHGSDAPAMPSSGYAPDGVMSSGGHEFAFHNIGLNTGKFSTPLLQMKKADSYLYNRDAICGMLSITIMGNSFNTYVDGVPYPTDATFFPKVSGYQSLSDCMEEKNGTDIEAKESGNESATHEAGTLYTASYETTPSYLYFRIHNESNYACYVQEISWVW